MFGLKTNKIEVTFAESANPIFHHGINIGVKLNPSVRKDMKLVINQELGILEIYLAGKYSALQLSALAHWIPKDPENAGFTIYDKDMKPVKQESFHQEPIVAQREMPHQVVQKAPQRRSVKDVLP